jgi:hypothetical protein
MKFRVSTVVAGFITAIVMAASLPASAQDFTDTAAAEILQLQLRTKELQARLTELLQRFNDKHPDVIETRKELAELQRQYQAEVEAFRHPPVVPAPPEPHLVPIPPYRVGDRAGRPEPIPPYRPGDPAAPRPVPIPPFRVDNPAAVHPMPPAFSHDDGPATKVNSNR